MDAFKQWALSLIVASAAGTFVMVISPGGSMDKTVRAVVGVFVVAAICSPLAGFASSDLSAEAMMNYEYDERDNSNKLQEYVFDVCRYEAEKQIVSVADKMGVRVKEICIDADIDTNECIIIHSVTVIIDEESVEKSSELSAAFEADLKVPVAVNAE